jgi:hypothetical protein
MRAAPATALSMQIANWFSDSQDKKIFLLIDDQIDGLYRIKLAPI